MKTIALRSFCQLASLSVIVVSSTFATAQAEQAVVPLYDFKYERYAYSARSFSRAVDQQVLPRDMVRANPKPKMALLAPLALVSLYSCRGCARNLPTESVPLYYAENSEARMQVIKVD